MSNLKHFIMQNRGLLIAILFLAIISSQVIQHSIQSERYGFVLVIVLAVGIIIGARIFAHRNSKRPPAENFHPTKPWKTPYEVTRAGLWFRAVFSSLTAFLIYTGMMAILWMTEGLNVAFAGIMSIQFLFWLPFLYWHSRRRYEPAPINQSNDRNPLLRHSDNPRKPSRRETLTSALIMCAAAATLATIGLWMT